MIYMPQVGRRTEKMKKVYRKEEGVSPVIATILMVAITVVLAATVYIMVAGMGAGGTNKMVASLTYKTDTSNPSAGWVNLTVSMSQPASAAPSKVTITVGGTALTYAASTTPAAGQWGFMDLDGNNELSDGDILIIHASGAVSSGTIIAMSISGYSGNAQITINA